MVNSSISPRVEMFQFGSLYLQFAPFRLIIGMQAISDRSCEGFKLFVLRTHLMSGKPRVACESLYCADLPMH